MLILKNILTGSTLIYLIIIATNIVNAQNSNYRTQEKKDTIILYSDSIVGENLNDSQIQFMTNLWLKNDLTITVSPNPVKSKFNIQTESLHPYLKSSNEMVIELYHATGQLLRTQSIRANDKLEFEIPKNYPSSFLIYKIVLNNALRTGKIEVIK
ncbi:MAG: hypothetical protein Q8K70_00205 [Bacteroidota bacterium]|nr:hypothetical protein [Bacteroidota bacterium]